MGPRYHRRHNRDEQRPPHAERADRQAAEHAGDDEGDPLHCADQTVGIRVPLFGDEECHGRRQSDVAHVLDDGSEQDDSREQPEPRPGDVNQRGLGLSEVESACDQKGHQCGGSGEDHYAMLAMPVDERAEPHREDGQQQHVRAADDPGRHHGASLEVHPEGQREPEVARRDVRSRSVHENVEEHALVRGTDQPRARRNCGIRRSGSRHAGKRTARLGRREQPDAATAAVALSPSRAPHARARQPRHRRHRSRDRQ